MYFLDGHAERRRREDMVLQAAVASGLITVAQAWPEFFGAGPAGTGLFPGKGTDTSGFTLEQATPESFAADMAALVASSSTVTVREPAPEPEPARGLPEQGHSYVPHTEWT